MRSQRKSDTTEVTQQQRTSVLNPTQPTGKLCLTKRMSVFQASELLTGLAAFTAPLHHLCLSSVLSAGHVLQEPPLQRGEVREGRWDRGRPLIYHSECSRTRWAGSADPTHQWTTYFSHHPVKWTSHSPSQAAQCQVDVCGFLVPQESS